MGKAKIQRQSLGPPVGSLPRLVDPDEFLFQGTFLDQHLLNTVGQRLIITVVGTDDNPKMMCRLFMQLDKMFPVVSKNRSLERNCMCQNIRILDPLTCFARLVSGENVMSEL